jgi:hypothetical protein
MADKTIGDYTAAVTIDASNDYYLIEQGGVYKKINRNVGLGLSSAPLGTTDSQSPQNKTFDNTNSITIKDGSLTIQNSSSTTKQAIFSNASITAGQTRTFTFPDLSGTLVTASGSQTLTNKTITSPTISGGSIDNTTITVDSISGHTSGTIVTIANLQISNGILNSNNSVVTANITDAAVTPAKLIAGTGSGWTWQSWTPTWANFTPGNATTDYKYIQVGKTVFFRVQVTLGSSSTMGSNPTFTLPITSISYATTQFQIAVGTYATNVGAARPALVSWSDTTHGILRTWDNNNDSNAVTATAPFAGGWLQNYTILFEGFYEAA